MEVHRPKRSIHKPERVLSLASVIPSFFDREELDYTEHFLESAMLIEHITESLYEWSQPISWHTRDQFIEHTALAKQRVDTLLDGIGFE